MTPPRGFEDWLAVLHASGIGETFQPHIGALLRVWAGTKNGAVCLASGREAVPYAHWLQDGMTMNSRLIVHSQTPEISDLVDPHFSSDIRVATHTQDFACFLADIEQHKFDLIVLDVNDQSSDISSTVLQRLEEHGMLLAVGVEVTHSPLIKACADAYFVSQTDEHDRGVIASKKSIQHRAVRRGGRRRHTNE